jgi:hypothetical protein
MNDTLTLKSGAKLDLQLANLESAGELFNAVLSEAKDAKIELGSAKSLEEIGELDISVFKNLLCGIIGSTRVQKAALDCMRTCKLNEQKITRETFVPHERRQDYLACVLEVTIYNLRPFFVGVDFASLMQRLVTPESQG